MTDAKCNHCQHDTDEHGPSGCGEPLEQRNNGSVVRFCSCARWGAECADPVGKQHWITAELRAILGQQAADGDQGARLVLRQRRRLESGVARQLTPAECSFSVTELDAEQEGLRAT